MRIAGILFVCASLYLPLATHAEENNQQPSEQSQPNESIKKIEGLSLPIKIETEEERFYRLRQAQDEKLQITAKDTSKICRTDIAIRVEWKNITVDTLEKNSIFGYCGEALDAISSVCSISDGQKAVKRNIREVLCVVGKEFNVSIKQGALMLQMDWNGQQDTMGKVYRYLLNNLE